ncbi:hypothetical protein QBC41DRAFT_371453 [Cercophora samala]|uniref:RING-type domain-containing protein n=1 Tax=Cercophora samala TaxID=330535 RepID=A0AA39ZIY4_9PEZI|nr:hypothetical protein QBC41DRAFT_371453 [Cercophora samala]
MAGLPRTRKEVTTWWYLDGYSDFPDYYDPFPPIVLCPICLEDEEIFTPFTPTKLVKQSRNGVVMMCGHMVCKKCYLDVKERAKKPDLFYTPGSLVPKPVLHCPYCRHALSFADTNYCRHPLAAYIIGSETPFPVPKTLTQSTETRLPQPRRTLSIEDRKKVPIPRHCNACRESRAKNMVAALRAHGWAPGNWEERWLRGSGRWHPEEVELAFPPSGSESILDKSIQDWEDYVLANLKKRLEDEGLTWGGNRWYSV